MVRSPKRGFRGVRTALMMALMMALMPGVVDSSLLHAQEPEYGVGGAEPGVQAPAWEVRGRYMGVQSREVDAQTTGQSIRSPGFITELHPQLEEYLRIAAEENPELNALWHQYRSELERVREAGVLPDPEVNVAYTFNPMMSESVTGRFSLSAMQIFPWFGTLGARRDVQRASAEADYHTMNGRRLELFREIRTTWTDLTGLQIQLDIAQETLELVRDLVLLVETRYETARTGQADLLRIQMEEERVKTLIANLEERALSLRARFNGYLGREPDAGVETAGRLEAMELPYSRDELVRRMQEQHPLFGELDAREQVVREQRRLARLEGRPGFSLGLEVMGRDFGAMSMFPDSGEMVVGMASVRVPLYRTQYRARDRQATLQLQSVVYQRQEAGNRLVSQLEEALGEWRSAARSAELFTDELIPRAEQALEILSDEYAAGNTRLDEVLQIQRQLLDLELERLDELVRLHLAVIRLETIAGEGIDNAGPNR